MTWTRYLFLGSVALIAVHIVDDSFLQPEAGTHAADHLVGGLVTLALLGLGTLGVPASSGRSRSSDRAGARVVRPDRQRRGLVRRDDGRAGRRRLHRAPGHRRGGSACSSSLSRTCGGPDAAKAAWRGSSIRRVAIGAASFVTIYVVVQPFLMAYAFTHISRAAVPEVDLGDADYVDVSFETSDGLTMHGWYLPSRNGAAVLAWAGRTHAQDAARFLSDEGYGVLLFDRRGEAASDGDPNALGWDRATDVEAGIDFLKARPDVDPERIGGIGYSVGGEMLLEAAAENDDLKAVVSEGAGIRSYKEGLELGGAQKWIHAPHVGDRSTARCRALGEQHAAGEPRRTWSTTSRRGRSCSSMPSAGRAARSSTRPTTRQPARRRRSGRPTARTSAATTPTPRSTRAGGRASSTSPCSQPATP